MFSHRSSQLLVVLLVVSILLGGCAGRNVSFEASPQELGRIGAALHEQPDEAEQILDKHNLTRKEFRESVNQISEDPDRARQYREAFEKAISSLRKSK
jgi:hypothetical protein